MASERLENRKWRIQTVSNLRSSVDALHSTVCMLSTVVCMLHTVVCRLHTNVCRLHAGCIYDRNCRLHTVVYSLHTTVSSSSSSAVSIAVSTTERHLERSCARSHAELRSRLVGCRSDSMVRSQVRRGRPLRRRQSVGRRLMAARRAWEWSCDGSARAICPNRRNRLDTMVQVTGGCPVLLMHTNKCANKTKNITSFSFIGRGNNDNVTWLFRGICGLNVIYCYFKVSANAIVMRLVTFYHSVSGQTGRWRPDWPVEA